MTVLKLVQMTEESIERLVSCQEAEAKEHCDDFRCRKLGGDPATYYSDSQ